MFRLDGRMSGWKVGREEGRRAGKEGGNVFICLLVSYVYLLIVRPCCSIYIDICGYVCVYV